MSANVYTTTIKNRSTITSEKPVQLTAAAKCDPGDRENQDSAYLKLDDSSIFVAVVADGVGGLANGGLVSGYITKAIEVWFNETISELRTLSIDEVQYEMKRVTDKTHEDLLAVAEETGQRHGSTMTFVILGKKKYALVQVGDSRAYLSNGNWVTRITKDQTVEEYEKKTGKTFDNLSKERKKHILMQCMGDKEIEPEIYVGMLPDNFDFLICSDGLSNTMSEVDIKKALKKNVSCSTTLTRMFRMARERGEKYKIKSTYQLRDWIKKYNGHKELKASGTGGAVIMTQGRKTTFDERVEIVQYCIAHERNYMETAEKYKVSYQQARSYTVKYEAGGVDALQDRRGRTKPQEEMSEVERLRAENKILRAEKERAEMEASFLKKLDEIERRRG